MSRITYLDGIAIGQLIFYSPALLTSIYICFKHGFAKASGWIFLVLFSSVRLAGAGARVYLIHNPSSSDAETAALICSILGLSPLLLAWLGLLSRILYSILDQPWRTIVSIVLVRAIQIPTTVGLILCIVGATSVDTPTQVYTESTVRIGIVLFTVVFALLLIFNVMAAVLARSTMRGEKVLLVAVNLAAPLMLVRLVYPLLAAFSHINLFQIGNESTSAVTTSLFMEVVEEFGVVIIYLVAGILQPAFPKDGSQEEGLAQRYNRADLPGRLEKLSFLATLFTTGSELKARRGYGRGVELQSRTSGERELRKHGLRGQV
ncbi:hypothetical protein M409DRAFT_54731 [Zasmidium cellare ATCC 36951]|uniref:DUF7702 domain-containing protein n=1 Tax=Zasmidium cellare ATCC 36951 TaxID=1080233 RepID=A0A6A6CIV2_ZASCE|nr:uncharacterized protein M409DRAFT_54731 [Zasmidium cellare ATCC 36951]KAF2166971.1 hypothetical protein M409DRAFT_54731 [Zasmidium cellare ATCC 36951]